VRVHDLNVRALQNNGSAGSEISGEALPQLKNFIVKKVFLIGFIACSWATCGNRAFGCDLCGCFTPQIATEQKIDPQPKFYAGLSEQFTYFGTMQFEGHEVANPTGQYLASSISQLFIGYEISDRFGLQVNLPLIYRDFKRPEGFAIDKGTESGIGDASLLLRAIAFKYSSGGGRTFDVSGKNPVAVEQEPDFTFSAVLLAGIKFPTGDSSRIEEEFHEVDVSGAPESGIHGHDLGRSARPNDTAGAHPMGFSGRVSGRRLWGQAIRGRRDGAVRSGRRASSQHCNGVCYRLCLIVRNRHVLPVPGGRGHSHRFSSADALDSWSFLASSSRCLAGT